MTITNFQPSVREPDGFAVELEFDRGVSGLNGDTIMLHCRDGVTLQQAKALRDLIKDLVLTIAITNPKGPSR